MAPQVEWFFRPPVRDHDFTADERFQWHRRQHVQTKAQTRNVDHDVVRGEIVEDVTECLVAKSDKACECHDQARKHRHAGRVVGDTGEVVDGRCAKRTVDQE